MRVADPEEAALAQTQRGHAPGVSHCALWGVLAKTFKCLSLFVHVCTSALQNIGSGNVVVFVSGLQPHTGLLLVGRKEV